MAAAGENQKLKLLYLYDILKAVFFLAAPLGWIVGGKNETCN